LRRPSRLVDCAQVIHERAKRAEAEGWPTPTGTLIDLFPEHQPPKGDGA
jgi:hypothetical protein